MMADRILTVEHGEVRLGDSLLPGLLKNLDLRGAVRFDEAEQDNMSGTTRTPMGWEDAEIGLTLELLSDETASCYERLAELDRLFRGHDDAGNPPVLTVVNAHVRARGVDRVVFAGLDSSETDEEDVIQASLHFVEHRPAVVAVEERGATPQVAGDSAASRAAVDEPALDTTLTVDVT